MLLPTELKILRLQGKVRVKVRFRVKVKVKGRVVVEGPGGGVVGDDEISPHHAGQHVGAGCGDG